MLLNTNLSQLKILILKRRGHSKLKLIELYIKDGSLDISRKPSNELKSEHKDDPDMMKNIDYVSGILMNE